MRSDEATVPTFGDHSYVRPQRDGRGRVPWSGEPGLGWCRDQTATAARSLAPSSPSTFVQYWKKRSRISSMVID
jgi:hypothetical protein